MFWSQKYSRGHHFFIRSLENSGGRGNPLFATGANAFRTTNFRSRFAMRGAEIHGNTRRDSATRIPSIEHCIVTIKMCRDLTDIHMTSTGGGKPRKQARI